MGRALAAGILRADPARAPALRLADALPAVAEEAAAELRAQLGNGAAGPTAAGVAEAGAADLVCLAVKPGDVEAALSEVVPAMPSGAALLSVVAGWTLDRLAALAPGVPVVRTMPNLAVRHGAGLVAVATRGLDSDREAALMALLGSLGTATALPESLFPQATALAGSGPGFLALVAEGLEEGAVAAGLGRPQARRMVQAVMAGTAAMLADGGDPALLRQRVSSPAGTTIEGIGVLERGAVRAHLADAVRAAAARARTL
ncbi:MAG: pyrroline-5-carboxylate reductase [Miltoncostaeaceae bacterium]|jgi:pyrroline-5-carboxylate reductase|nr:pyrroline-5-carboxylate reductase [Miltoncostaeaceae bacterium]